MGSTGFARDDKNEGGGGGRCVGRGRIGIAGGLEPAAAADAINGAKDAGGAGTIK